MCNGDHLHAELGGALRQGTQHAFAAALFVVVLALVRVLLALGQHGVDQSRQFVGTNSCRLDSEPRDAAEIESCKEAVYRSRGASSLS